jgi:hypothetical protein
VGERDRGGSHGSGFKKLKDYEILSQPLKILIYLGGGREAEHKL